MSIRAGPWPGDISSCLGRKITGGCRTQVFYLLFSFLLEVCPSCALTPIYYSLWEPEVAVDFISVWWRISNWGQGFIFALLLSSLRPLNSCGPPLSPHFRDVMPLWLSGRSQLQSSPQCGLGRSADRGRITAAPFWTLKWGMGHRHAVAIVSP